MLKSCALAALQPELLRTLKPTLEPELEVVAMVDNTLSLQDSLGVLDPDVAIIDIDVLGATPWKHVRHLRRNAPGMLLIILAATAGPEDIDQARDAGADHMIERASIARTLTAIALESISR